MSGGAGWPFRTLPNPPRRPALGRALIALGYAFPFLLTAVLLTIAALADAVNGFWPNGGVLIVLMTHALIAALVWRLPSLVRLVERGRQYLALPAAEALAADPRPPILLLRAFGDDDLFDPGVQRSPFDFAPVRYEARIARALAPFGPIVAIGRPGEPLPAAGAARLYVHNDDWQAAVLHFLDRARLVFLMVGATEGVAWEIETVLRRCPEKTVFFVPFSDPRPLGRDGLKALFQYASGLRIFYVRRLRRLVRAERDRRYELLRARVEASSRFRLPERLAPGAQFIALAADGTVTVLHNRRTLMQRISGLLDIGELNVDFGKTLAPLLKGRPS